MLLSTHTPADRIHIMSVKTKIPKNSLPFPLRIDVFLILSRFHSNLNLRLRFWALGLMCSYECQKVINENTLILLCCATLSLGKHTPFIWIALHIKDDLSSLCDITQYGFINKIQCCVHSAKWWWWWRYGLSLWNVWVFSTSHFSSTAQRFNPSTYGVGVEPFFSSCSVCIGHTMSTCQRCGSIINFTHLWYPFIHIITRVFLLPLFHHSAQVKTYFMFTYRNVCVCVCIISVLNVYLCYCWCTNVRFSMAHNGAYAYFIFGRNRCLLFFVVNITAGGWRWKWAAGWCLLRVAMKLSF